MDIVFTINGIVAGFVLLGISVNGTVSGFLRVFSFILGLIALTHFLIILDDILYSYGSDREGFTSKLGSSLYESIISRDREVHYGKGTGRVYLRPRIPMVNNGVRVNVKGTPGSKIVYWPVGGSGIGGRNDEMDLHGASIQEIRTRALGAGVSVLDEIGHGIAITEDGVGEVLFREIHGDKGGPVNRVRLQK